MSTPASRRCGLFGEGLPGTPGLLRGVRGASRNRQASEAAGPAPGTAAYLTASSVTLAASFDLSGPGVFTCRKGVVSSSGLRGARWPWLCGGVRGWGWEAGGRGRASLLQPPPRAHGLLAPRGRRSPGARGTCWGPARVLVLTARP